MDLFEVSSFWLGAKHHGYRSILAVFHTFLYCISSLANNWNTLQCLNDFHYLGITVNRHSKLAHPYK